MPPKALIIIPLILIATTLGGAVVFYTMLQNAGCPPSLMIRYANDYEINETVVNHYYPLVNTSIDDISNVPLIKNGIIELSQSNKTHITVDLTRDQLNSISDYLRSLPPVNSSIVLFYYEDSFYEVGFLYC